MNKTLVILASLALAFAGTYLWQANEVDQQHSANQAGKHITDLAREMQPIARKEGLARDPAYAEGALRQDEAELEEIKRWHEARMKK